KARAAAKRGGSSREEDVALPARHHQPRRFAPSDKAGPASHLPHLAKYAIGGLQNREIDIGTDIEDADFERRVLVGVIEEIGRLLLLPRVKRAAEDGAAGGFHLLHQWLELLAVAPSCEYGEAFRGEFLDDLGADIIARADHSDCGVTLLHGCSPLS